MLTPQKEPSPLLRNFYYLWLAPALVIVLPAAVILLGWITGHSPGWIFVCSALIAVGMFMIVWPQIPQAIYEFWNFPFGMIFDHDTELSWYRTSGVLILIVAVLIGWKSW